MGVPRIIKIIMVAAIIFAAWKLLPSALTFTHRSAPENAPQGVRPTAPLEIFADGIVHAVYPNATLFMHHGTAMKGRITYFLYYRPVPDNPEALISYLSGNGEIKKEVGGKNWYVSAEIPHDGNTVVIDFYPDYEKNALVVMVR